MNIESLREYCLSKTGVEETLPFGPVRKIIGEKQIKLEQSGVNRNELVVLIKPDKESTYKNTVNILDEMTINVVTRYGIVKPGAGDLQFLEHNR